MRATDGSGLRKRQRSGFAAVPNDTVWDDELPTRALGVLTKLIALPDDWKLETDWLVSKCSDGREAVMTALRALRRLGYYRVERRRLANGKFVTGVSVSDVRVPEWAAQHAQACTDQGTNKPKWDVTLRLLDDGRVEDEPAKGPVDKTAGQTGNGFSDAGETGDRFDRTPVQPVTGDPDVKTQTDTQTDTQGGAVEDVPHEADVPAEQPPLDAPDGTHRTCPQHRVTPAPGPCTPCGQHRVAWQRRESMLDADQAEQRMAAADAERRAKRELRQLAVAEVVSCGYCDDDGTAFHDVDGEPGTTVCQHDADANIGAIRTRRRMRAELAAAAQRPAVYGRKG